MNSDPSSPGRPFNLDLRIDDPTLIEDTKQILNAARDEIRSGMNRIVFLEKERAASAAEREEMIIELRLLRDERDPTIIADLIRRARDAATAESAATIAALRSEVASLRSSVAELQTSKRRLREALERTKAAR